MDSTISTFKGYGMILDHAGDRPPTSRGATRVLFLALSLLLLLLLLLAAAATVANKPSSPPRPSRTLRTVCSITLHSRSCLSALSDSNSTDPRDLFSLSLRVSIAALRAVTDVPRQLSSRVNDSMVKEALDTCTDLIQDALDNLNTSLALVTPPTPWEKVVLTNAKVEDLRTYLSAVLTDIDACLDGFDGTKGGFQKKLGEALENSTELASNSLAIATHILLPPGTGHRKLLRMVRL